jgi:hypothetical protein
MGNSLLNVGEMRERSGKKKEVVSKPCEPEPTCRQTGLSKAEKV